MWRSILMGSTALGALALVLAACGGGGTGTGGGASGTGGGACGTTTWSKTNMLCNACMESSCCNQLAACDAGTSCGKLLACIEACAPSDAGCTQTCESSQSDGVSALNALVSCHDSACQGSCGANVCDSGVVVSSPACADCLTADCCDSWKACSQDDACRGCLTGAQTSGCDGSSLYTLAKECLSTSCGDVCTETICDSKLGTDQPACNHCLGQSDTAGGCCEETKACEADAACKDCITGKVTIGCDANAAYQSFSSCAGKCSAVCG